MDWVKEVYNNPESLNFLKGIWGGSMDILKFVWMMGEIIFWLIQEPAYFVMMALTFIFLMALSARNIVTWWRYIFRNSNRVYESTSTKLERLFTMAINLFRFLRELSPI